MGRLTSSQDLERYRQSLVLGQDPNKLVVNVCVDTGCAALGAERIFSALSHELKKRYSYC